MIDFNKITVFVWKHDETDPTLLYNSYCQEYQFRPTFDEAKRMIVYIQSQLDWKISNPVAMKKTIQIIKEELNGS